VLFANLREASLDRIRTEPVKDLEGALRYAAGAMYERDRAATTQRVQASGAMLMEALPETLAVSLVNRYLDLKRSGRF
jgi:hypothetical protein